MKPILLLLLCLLAVQQSPTSPKVAYGIGGQRSCAEWTRTKTIDVTDPAARAMHTLLFAWVEGFVTGAAAYSEREIPKTDGAAIEAYVDQFCVNNPSAPVSHAGIAFLYELVKDRP
jgi:hypothetical protein